jgi:hypothetical protein
LFCPKMSLFCSHFLNFCNNFRLTKIYKKSTVSIPQYPSCNSPIFIQLQKMGN